MLGKSSRFRQIANALLAEGSSPSEDGFTLIELMVVILMASILFTIAMPSMLRFANRAKESEARTYLSETNKAQQMFYLENGRFSEDLASLAVTTPSSTSNYTYVPIVDNPNGIAHTEARPIGVMRGFTGKVWLGTVGSEVILQSLLCAGPSGSAPTVTGSTCP